MSARPHHAFGHPGRLQQVCDEMDLAFSRAAFSPVIAEANDRSDGIYRPTTAR